MPKYFEDGLEQLQRNLPHWWAHMEPTSQLAILLAAVAPAIDELSVEMEGIFADQALATARGPALRSEWAVLYGVEDEQLPFDDETLRAYLQALADDDGSIVALRRILRALVNTPANVGKGDDADEAALTFPADGTGLTFPADGTGLTFPAVPRVEVVVAYADYTFTVKVRNDLAFDRPAFARAVARARMAHQTAPTILEVAP